MEMHVKNKLSAILLVCVMLLSSCGYRLTPVGGIVSEDAKTIAIPVFVNGTNEPNVDMTLTQAVVNEFLTDGRLKIASPDDADLILRCKVVKFDVSAIAYTTNTYVQQYNISISVDARLTETKSNKVLWQEKNLGSVFTASYPVTLGDITVTKIAKQTAITSASQDLASTIRSRVLEGF
jgi:outer membrane lipopolysaccharide assembly protein LptE/RlpB